MVAILLILLFACSEAVPVLNMTGFAWAENLIFSQGSLFVSDTVTGMACQGVNAVY